jgi:DNA-binding IclR family transcriptional regulator
MSASSTTASSTTASPSTAGPHTASPAETSRTLIRGLNLFKQFTVERPVLSLAELALGMGLSAPAAHRYAVTCLDLGYLEQDALRRYRLTRRAGEPGKALLGSWAPTRHARPILRELRRETGRTVSLAVLEHAEVLYLQRLCGYQAGQYELERGLGAGTRLPAEQTAAGKALLDAPAAVGVGDRSRPRDAPPTRAQDAHSRPLDRHSLCSAGRGPSADARGLAIAVGVEGERTSALEVTAPRETIGAAELLAELGEPLLRAGNALREALIDDCADRGGTEQAL